MYQYYCFKDLSSTLYSQLVQQNRFNLQIVQPHNNFHDLLWTLFSRGKFREYRLYHDSSIIAFAQVMPKIFIFNFMDRKGLHIGPCWTHPNFRGQGLYPYLLRKIIYDYKNKIENFYIFTSKDNIASQRGIEKAGGLLFANGYKNRFGIYKIAQMMDF